jgi:hypothetical protein
MNMLVHATNPIVTQWREAVLSSNTEPKMFTAGAAPPAAVIELMEDLGFDVTHVYGLTEVPTPTPHVYGLTEVPTLHTKYTA